MRYGNFGNTGVETSKLGFGCMRLPTIEKNGKMVVDVDRATAMLCSAVTMGINYFDTAYMYHNGESELVLGQAMKDLRDKVFISTKSPSGENKKPGDYRRLLEEQLTKLDMSYIDFYHFHGISYEGFMEVDKRSNWLDAAVKAKEEGLIRNISFSFHSKYPEDMKKLIDIGCFGSVLCQYNILDRSNEEGMAYAHEKGLGVVIMGPLGGGRVSGLPDKIKSELGIKASDSSELGLRFVASNPNVNVILSGMSTEKQLIDNFAYISAWEPLSEKETANFITMMEENKRLSDLYCTGCNYCMPCPQGVDISNIFKLANYYKIYGIKDYARKAYSEIGTGWNHWKHADACNKCGVCETKCPQNLEIRNQLVESAKILS